jgi:hypothetical protein
VLLRASDLAANLREVRSLRSDLDVLREEVVRERAMDRRRMAALEVHEPQPVQKDRGEILLVFLAVNGCKMLAKDARKRLQALFRKFKTIFD